MIRVTVRRKDKNIQSFEISGHAESGPYGYDLVCAGVSAVSFGAVNAVLELSDVNLEIEQSGEGGYLMVAFPEMHDNKTSEKAQLLFEGMLVSLKTIEIEYGKFIRITES